MIKTPDQIGVSPVRLEHMFDTMEAYIKNGRAGALTPVNPDLTTDKEWLVKSVSKNRQTRHKIAEDYLSLSREHLERAKSLRLHYAMLAFDEGMTYERIGELLGITGAAVRLMIARAA